MISQADKKTTFYIPRLATFTMLGLVACGALLLLTSWAFAGVVGADGAIPAVSEAYGSRFLTSEPATEGLPASAPVVDALNEWKFTRLHVSKSR